MSPENQWALRRGPPSHSGDIYAAAGGPSSSASRPAHPTWQRGTALTRTCTNTLRISRGVLPEATCATSPASGPWRRTCRRPPTRVVFSGTRVPAAGRLRRRLGGARGGRGDLARRVGMLLLLHPARRRSAAGTSIASTTLGGRQARGSRKLLIGSAAGCAGAAASRRAACATRLRHNRPASGSVVAHSGNVATLQRRPARLPVRPAHRCGDSRIQLDAGQGVAARFTLPHRPAVPATPPAAPVTSPNRPATHHDDGGRPAMTTERQGTDGKHPATPTSPHHPGAAKARRRPGNHHPGGRGRRWRRPTTHGGGDGRGCYGGGRRRPGHTPAAETAAERRPADKQAAETAGGTTRTLSPREPGGGSARALTP